MKHILNVPVLIVDGVPDCTNEVFASNGVKVADKIPVVVDFDSTKPVGWATLHKRENTYYADLELLDDFKPKGLIPAIAGRIQKMTKLESGIVVLGEVEITNLSLNNSPNSDSRIKPI